MYLDCPRQRTCACQFYILLTHWIFYYYLINLFIWERETSTSCSTYLCIHWLIPTCALTRDWTCNLGMLGLHSHPLSYLARAGRIFYSFVCLFIYLDFIYLLLERGKGREKERERNINVSTLIWLPLIRPQLKTWPATQACALTGNRTNDLLVHRLALSPLNHTRKDAGLNLLFFKLIMIP